MKSNGDNHNRHILIIIQQNNFNWIRLSKTVRITKVWIHVNCQSQRMRYMTKTLEFIIISKCYEKPKFKNMIIISSFRFRNYLWKAWHNLYMYTLKIASIWPKTYTSVHICLQRFLSVKEQSPRPKMGGHTFLWLHSPAKVPKISKNWK